MSTKDPSDAAAVGPFPSAPDGAPSGVVPVRRSVAELLDDRGQLLDAAADLVARLPLGQPRDDLARAIATQRRLEPEGDSPLAREAALDLIALARAVLDLAKAAEAR